MGKNKNINGGYLSSMFINPTDIIFKLLENKNSIDNDSSEKKLRPGDIIGVSRTFYEHYGVYVGNNDVIHFSSKIPSEENKIILTDINTFLKNEEDYFILVFPEKYNKPQKIFRKKSVLPNSLKRFNYQGNIVSLLIGVYKSIRRNKKMKDYKLYSPTETVRRAKRKLGEKEYNIITNNCEHFAIWCKTGIEESHQVEELVSILTENNLIIRNPFVLY